MKSFGHVLLFFFFSMQTHGFVDMVRYGLLILVWFGQGIAGWEGDGHELERILGVERIFLGIWNSGFFLAIVRWAGRRGGGSEWGLGGRGRKVEKGEPLSYLLIKWRVFIASPLRSPLTPLPSPLFPLPPPIQSPSSPSSPSHTNTNTNTYTYPIQTHISLVTLFPFPPISTSNLLSIIANQ